MILKSISFIINWNDSFSYKNIEITLNEILIVLNSIDFKVFKIIFQKALEWILNPNEKARP